MTTDAATSTSNTNDPAPPSIDELLSWDVESRGEIPEEHRNLSVEQVRDLVAAREQAAAAAREQAILDRVRAEQQQAAAAANQTAQEKLDADYYISLKERLASSDAEVAAAANQELLKNEARYRAGAAALERTSEQAVQNRVIANFFDAMATGLEQAGMTGILPRVGDPRWYSLQQELQQYDGKGGIAAFLINRGRELARAEAADEAARQSRIQTNASNVGPGLGSGSSVVGGRENYADPAWVQQQMASDPEWSFKLSPDGKLSNIQRVRREAVPALKAGAR